MLLKRLCALLLLACFCLPLVLPADIYLTDAEMQAIRRELEQMSAATIMLQNELNEQQERSKLLVEMSEKLRERLESALVKLEESESLLEISETELAALLLELGVLRTEYSVLWESWTAQKNETRKWKMLSTAGWISAGLVLVSSIVLGVLK